MASGESPKKIRNAPINIAQGKAEEFKRELVSKYLSGYWEKYEIKVSVFDTTCLPLVQGSLPDRDNLNYFEEQQESSKIKVDVTFTVDVSLYANRVLVDLLLTNLIKNAYFHNTRNGTIHIQISDGKFSISNTSVNEAIPESKLFHRFYKQSTNRESWGLGLALVKKICDINEWRISYSKVDTLHSFVVYFKGLV